jgi:hypothetical protein
MALYRIRTRRDIASNWVIANPVLGLGEQGEETDTRRIKAGDGVNSWNALPYLLNTLPVISGSRSVPNDIDAITGIVPPGGYNQVMYVQGAGGDIIVTADPQIAPGLNDGELLELRGRNNLQLLTLSDGFGLSLNGACTLGADWSLWLRWDTLNWVEISRRENA